MPVNGTTSEGLATADLRRRCNLTFDRMDRYVSRLAKEAQPENVHRFRTNSRRVEALIAEFQPDGRNKEKLLKQLSKWRKRAGKVRDLDVQIAFLKDLKIPDRQNHRLQLLEALVEEQDRRKRKLSKSLDAEKVRSLRKRMRRAKAEMQVEGVDPVSLAVQRLPKLPETPLNEKMLHAWRIGAKQSRYLAELGGDAAEAKAVVAELKRAQDEIGGWHDVLKLNERAAKLFGSAHDSPLVSMLQNISRARFKRASAALATTLRNITESRQAPARPRAVSSVQATVSTQSAAA